jgi:hypothetical protein
MVNLPTALAYLYPSAVPLVDYSVQDDGQGPYIAFWSAALGARPTAAQLQAASDAAALAVTRAAKTAGIIARTAQLRRQGVSYQPSGAQAASLFALDSKSLHRLDLRSQQAQAGKLSYPVSQLTTGNTLVQLQTVGDVTGLFWAAAARLEALIGGTPTVQGEHALLAAVAAAQTLAALDAVVDTRT